MPTLRCVSTELRNRVIGSCTHYLWLAPALIRLSGPISHTSHTNTASIRLSQRSYRAAILIIHNLITIVELTNRVFVLTSFALKVKRFKMNYPANIRDKLVVALDVPNRAAALGIVEELSDLAGMFKIGSQLFTAEGPSLVRDIVTSGHRVFLDLKFHDIPNTVAAAARSAAGLGVSIFNVHGVGGVEMMRAAADAVSAFAPDRRPRVLAVTVLTSMNSASLSEVGITGGVSSQVIRLASLARAAGLDGAVASPQEISLIRERVAAENFIILTPGVRPAGSESGDQKRIATPGEAIRLGADLIVVGRPIIAAANRREAAQRVLAEMAGGM